MCVPVADLESLERELDVECARELALSFLEDASLLLIGIDAAVERREAVQLRSHAHGVKGCCRTIRALAAEEITNELESAAMSEDWQKIPAIRLQLAAAYDQVRRYITSYLAS